MNNAYTHFSHSFDQETSIEPTAFTLPKQPNKIVINIKQPSVFGHDISLVMTPTQVDTLVEFLQKVQVQIYPINVT